MSKKQRKSHDVREWLVALAPYAVALIGVVSLLLVNGP